jgi:hypothetical protein
MLIFIATGRLSSRLASSTINPVSGLTSLGKLSGPYPSTGYGGVAVGEGVGVSVSAGVNGLGEGDGVTVGSVTCGGMVATTSSGLGSPVPQAATSNAVNNRIKMFFIRVHSPRSGNQVRIIL